MPTLTPLNLEQSIARYLADKLKSVGYNVLWKPTGQLESVSGQYTVTIIKEFPVEISDYLPHGEIGGPTSVNVPAFSVFSSIPGTTQDDRQGIGEGVFEWETDIRIDGFANDELQWYKFKTYFKEWFGHPDVYVTLYDYESDLTNTSPSAQEEKIQFISTTIIANELDEKPAVRYYLNLSTTAVFVE